ncbi:hypothetical protein DFH09DRAFT_1328527 [Mycena vulgaris]|nr:hypothetical protein DFH09DRAFT_1328527 [Mycena vulgaris]
MPATPSSSPPNPSTKAASTPLRDRRGFRLSLRSPSPGATTADREESVLPIDRHLACQLAQRGTLPRDRGRQVSERGAILMGYRYIPRG